ARVVQDDVAVAPAAHDAWFRPHQHGPRLRRPGLAGEYDERPTPDLEGVLGLHSAARDGFHGGPSSTQARSWHGRVRARCFSDLVQHAGTRDSFEQSFLRTVFTRTIGRHPSGPISSQALML